jgi:crotonobetainyl-CoA:carnitine CoA-transferase CaiB-like acyl-CoA transferase
MDILGQARGGLMSVTGGASGPPRSAGAAIADHTGALTMAFGLATALFHRDRTGEGQEVDASLLGGQLCIQTHNITYSWWSGKVPKRRDRLASATWNSYQGSDGKWFALGMNRQMYWPGICKVTGRLDWLDDERYGQLETRLVHADALYDDLQAIFSTKPAGEWVRAFADADLLATPINDYEDLSNDPQVIANYVDHIEPPDGSGPLPIVGLPVVFSKTPGHARGMAPEFGQHTEEVLLEAGYEWDEIAALKEEGAVGIHA